MFLLSKFKETAYSVLPIMAIVLILGGFFYPIGATACAKFALGGTLLIFGLTIFLHGVDSGIKPLGELIGGKLVAKGSLPIFLLSAFFIGFIVTAAEPDIEVFATQVKGIFPALNKLILTLVIAGGVGLFLTLGLIRSAKSLNLKLTLLISYGILFSICYLAPKTFIGISFDSGGATTGPLTVPFIMALGLGVAKTKSDDDGTFGLTGIASVGPIMATLLYSLYLTDGTQSTSTFISNNSILHSSIKDATTSIIPLYTLFIIFNLLLLRLPTRQFLRTTTGFLFALIGLIIFLCGIKCGFTQAGTLLSAQIGTAAHASLHGEIILILLGIGLGAIIVAAEPAVWVLSEEVEQISQGAIPRRSLLIFLSIGTGIAIALSLLRAIHNWDLIYILVPGYLTALILMKFCPSLFTGIAFDSGGVASGPLTSSFILAFALGAAGKNTTDPFGVIALVAMMPLIAIQIMGIIYNHKTRKALTK